MIESVNHLLKNSCQIEYHRHPSRWNFLSNLMVGFANYCSNLSKLRLLFSNTEIESASLLEYF
ncbi:hypothetical protein PRO82_000233 [Candidatus Protochlamydia amoebophila]|uniref:hypothetical protein n=1 Tax=Candidatus Protochlamydia amoebophila TaxID=362787 RepID=UPI001BC913CA|nr:hypothetical protein [Candidatus Protochlamydia amoebophila]MBS4162953.1 hypothetical protein [Candidatus Protochlamydia amoebophila]